MIALLPNILYQPPLGGHPSHRGPGRLHEEYTADFSVACVMPKGKRKPNKRIRAHDRKPTSSFSLDKSLTCPPGDYGLRTAASAAGIDAAL